MKRSERYICIHGHFYQPPRENPWLEAIELQSSAYPYHDWNARITDECYGPNSTSRILDSEKRITEIVNNYSKISFNFGPTLLAWMQDSSPGVYEAILQADRESRKLYSGHGSAIAQVYNHLIMPLASRRDKYTQIIWGIRDFEHRFGRQPEGMWLSETAVDLETLDILAEQRIKFTILEPRQASFVRQIGAPEWEDVSGGRIDPARTYQINLPSQRTMALFFYDGPISRAVAFERLLDNGENFANRLMSGFSDQRQWPQLVHIATDGESYGHHHHYGEMALSYALRYIEEKKLARLTNYGEYLSRYPPAYEVKIIEQTSWSCIHGVERWRRNCGCSTGGHPGWNQEWRAPLRQSLDWLRDTVAPEFEDKAGVLLKDPWEARNDYISVILDRSPQNVSRFLDQHCTHELKKDERVSVFKLLELQRHAMLMYTSCGWFFDDLSGIETVQVIHYAGRVVQLSEELFGDNTEDKFLKRLEAARSNVPKYKNGKIIYEKFVKPSMIDLVKVGAHFAISSLFEEYSRPASIYCYLINSEDYRRAECGKARLAVGRAWVTSVITHDARLISFCVLHFGDHNVNAGVRSYIGKEAYNEMVSEMIRTFSSGEFPAVIRLMDKYFGASNYSLKSLFRDEQRKILDKILESTLTDIESEYRKIYQANYPLMRFLSDLGKFVPRAFLSSAGLILNNDLRRALAADNPDEEVIGKLLSDIKLWKVGLAADLGHVFRQTLEKKMIGLAGSPGDTLLLSQVLALVNLVRSLSFAVELREVQNTYYRILKTAYPEALARAEHGDQSKVEWVTQFIKLGEVLSVRVA